MKLVLSSSSPDAANATPENVSKITDNKKLNLIILLNIKILFITYFE